MALFNGREDGGMMTLMGRYTGSLFAIESGVLAGKKSGQLKSIPICII
jgi:hypothetical protein